MVTLSSFRDKLDSKIWTADIASSVTVYGLASSVINDYQEVFWTNSAGLITQCVPYTTFAFQKDWESWGEPKSGQTDMAFPYYTNIAEDYIVVDSNFLTKSYIVAEVENFPYGGGNLAIVARLTEQIDN